MKPSKTHRPTKPTTKATIRRQATELVEMLLDGAIVVPFNKQLRELRRTVNIEKWRRIRAASPEVEAEVLRLLRRA